MIGGGPGALDPGNFVATFAGAGASPTARPPAAANGEWAEEYSAEYGRPFWRHNGTKETTWHQYEGPVLLLRQKCPALLSTPMGCYAYQSAGMMAGRHCV